MSGEETAHSTDQAGATDTAGAHTGPAEQAGQEHTGPGALIQLIGADGNVKDERRGGV